MQENNTQDKPLYEMEPLARFSDRAVDYAKFRPSYPAAAIDLLVEGLDRPVVADIGAGTGIASLLFAERGIQVMAIEPNQAMRQAAKSHPLLEFRERSAEAIELPNNSVELVTSFNAFHWFNPKTSLREFRRVLKPSGRLGIIWSNFDSDDRFTNGYLQLLLTASNNHAATAAIDSPEPLRVSPYFTNFRSHTFRDRQKLDLAGLMGNASSFSAIPKTGPAIEQLRSALEALYSQWADGDGKVSLVYRVDVHLADPKQ